MLLQATRDPPPMPAPGGILDFNLTLNFAPQMRKEFLDYLYETRDLVLSVEWWTVAGVAFLVGCIVTTIVFLALRSGRRPATLSAVLAALLSLATPLYAQQPRDPIPAEPMVDLTTLKYVDKNFGSKRDGAGMCVYNSFRALFVSQYAAEYDDYARWLADNFPGGGYPSRVTEYTEAYCRAKNRPVPDYTQIVGERTSDEAIDALEDGKSVAVTYSGDPSFYGGPVPHMCNLVYLDNAWAAIVDNNRPDRVEWIPRRTYEQRHRHYDAGWAIVYHGKPQLARPVNPSDVPQSRPARFRGSLTLDPDVQRSASGGVLLIGAPSPQWGAGSCGPVRIAPTPVERRGDVPAEWKGNDGTFYWETPRPDGTVRLLDSRGVIVGEWRGDAYFVYGLDAWGRETLIPASCPVLPPGRGGDAPRRDPRDLPTGVVTSRIPRPSPGRTMYGTAVSELRDDAAGPLLFAERMRQDREKPKIVINLDDATQEYLDALIAQLRRIKALDRVFIYARDAANVIKLLGFGKGLTVLGKSNRGVAQECGYFADGQPTDEQLTTALLKADPAYRPGSSGPIAGGVDPVLLCLGGVIAVLAVAVLAALSRLVNSR